MSLRRTTVQEDFLASIAWRDLREQGVPTVAARRARCVAILDQRVEELMYRVKLYDPEAHSYRIRYAIATILRDRIANDGGFRVCFEMLDEEEVIRGILSRGLKNQRLRSALERSHLIDLTHWLLRFPDLAEAYYASGSSSAEQ